MPSRRTRDHAWIERTPDLSHSLFDTLLFIHMAALGVLPPGGQELATTGSIRADLLAAALRREATYWLDMATAVSLPPEVDHRVQRRAVAVATLCAPTATGTPVDEREAAALLEVLPDLEGVAIRRRVARWLHDLYPARAGWIGPLEPDLLGEALVAETVGEVRELARDLLARVDDETRKRALTVLTRGARNHNACRDALADALDHQLETSRMSPPSSRDISAIRWDHCSQPRSRDTLTRPLSPVSSPPFPTAPYTYAKS